MKPSLTSLNKKHGHIRKLRSQTDSRSCSMEQNMRVAIVYASVTGNTRELAEAIQEKFQQRMVEAELFTVKDFLQEDVSAYDGLVLGTFTWSNGWSHGCIPRVMQRMYDDLERVATSQLATA